ncbi:MAG: Ig-like domain-containing protein [Candidatus Zixiibacteriota bacterium]
MKRRSLVALALLVPLFLSCAKQQQPPGGPEDKTSPEIISTIPESGTTEVSRLPEITVSFSERMNKERTREAIFVSPPTDGDLRIDWKKNNLRIGFSDSLDADRTYLVTIGSGATDEHNNRLTQSISVAFSTGSSLDSGSISGTVRSKGLPHGGATVTAYMLAQVDSLNLSEMRPQYITQTGSDGTYQLSYVSPGDYLLFAFDDGNRNNTWDPPKEQIGFPSLPALVTPTVSATSSIDITMTSRDTVRLGVASATISSDRVLRVEMTHMALKQNIENARMALISADSPDTIQTDAIFVFTDSAKSFVAVLPDVEFPEALYLQIENLSDIWGNEIATVEDSILLQPPIGSDRQPPTVETVDPPSGSRGISVNPVITVRFNEPVRFDSDSGGMTLFTPDSLPLPCEHDQLDAFRISFIPTDTLMQALDYRAVLDLGAVADRSGNRVTDSTYSFRFETVNRDSLGSFSGTVTFAQRMKDQLPKVFFALLPNGNWTPLEVSLTGTFSKDAEPGKYKFTGFYDRDNDGFYSSGRIMPFEYAEPMIIINDTVSVRSRFETEDVVLQER